MTRRKWLLLAVAVIATICSGLLLQHLGGSRQTVAEGSAYTRLQQAVTNQQQAANFLYWVDNFHLAVPDSGQSLKQESMTTGKASFQGNVPKGFAEDTEIHTWGGTGATEVRLSDYIYHLFYLPERGLYSGGSVKGAAPAWKRLDTAGATLKELPEYQHILYLRKPLGDLNWLERVEEVGQKDVNGEKWLELKLVIESQSLKQAYAYLVNSSLKSSEITGIDKFTVTAWVDEQNNLRQIAIDSVIRYLLKETNYPAEKGTITNKIKINIEQVENSLKFTPPAGLANAE